MDVENYTKNRIVEICEYLLFASTMIGFIIMLILVKDTAYNSIQLLLMIFMFIVLTCIPLGHFNTRSSLFDSRGIFIIDHKDRAIGLFNLIFLILFILFHIAYKASLGSS